jgi:soluble epoxide hydrolase/lipid-phosphate phosphatase
MELKSSAEIAAEIPTTSYQAYFASSPNKAIAELNDDIRQSLRSCTLRGDTPYPKDLYTKNNTFLGPWKDFMWPIPASGLWDDRLENYVVEQYSKQGFKYSKS